MAEKGGRGLPDSRISLCPQSYPGRAPKTQGRRNVAQDMHSTFEHHLGLPMSDDVDIEAMAKSDAGNLAQVAGGSEAGQHPRRRNRQLGSSWPAAA